MRNPGGKTARFIGLPSDFLRVPEKYLFPSFFGDLEPAPFFVRRLVVMKDYAAGDVLFAQSPSPIKALPVGVLSRGEINMVRENIVVALMARTMRRIPWEIFVGAAEGLPKEAVVSVGDIRTVSRSFLGPIGGRLSPVKQVKLKQALELLLGLEEDGILGV